MGELGTVPDPCIPAGECGRVKAEGEDPFCLFELLQRKSHFHFQRQALLRSDLGCQERCCPGAKGELPSGSFVHHAEILKASICWKSQALLLTARYSGLSLKMESLKACLEQEQQMIAAAILSSLGVSFTISNHYVVLPVPSLL